MLVFQVSEGESFYVGESRVQVVRIQPGRIRVAIDAAPSVEVDRERVREEKVRRRIAPLPPIEAERKSVNE